MNMEQLQKDIDLAVQRKMAAMGVAAGLPSSMPKTTTSSSTALIKPVAPVAPKSPYVSVDNNAQAGAKAPIGNVRNQTGSTGTLG